MADNVGKLENTAIPNPSRMYRRWRIDEVYGLGNSPTNRHVPNVKDTVLDVDSQIEYLVTDINEDNIPTIVPLNLSGGLGITSNSTIIGTGPGLVSEGYRIYVNNKVLPRPCFIDNRVIIAGSENHYIKIFKGFKTDNSGEVVSGVFNSVNRMVSENIELEPVVIPHYPNNTYKVAKAGFLTSTLQDGEVVTVVVYSRAGNVTMKFGLVVVNTEFVRNIDASKKHITDIKLITPYLSPDDALQVNIPTGMVVQSSSFMGQVSYSDGSKAQYPVDGNKFALHGIDNYIGSRIGDSVPLVLRYSLAKGEYSNIANAVGNNYFVNKSYRLTTVESDNKYNVKLFIIPIWSEQHSRWSLAYLLYNLEREVVWNVTDYIEYTQGTSRFDGRLFGQAQQLQVAVNLDRIGGGYSYYRHVETFTITLHGPVTSEIKSSHYELAYDTDSVVARDTTILVSGSKPNYTLRLMSSLNSVDKILDRLYYSTSPLMYPFNESRPPRPTHVRISRMTKEKVVAIDELLDDISFTDNLNFSITQEPNFTLKFLQIKGVNTLELGAVGLVAQLS